MATDAQVIQSLIAELRVAIRNAACENDPIVAGIITELSWLLAQDTDGRLAETCAIPELAFEALLREGRLYNL